MGLFWDLIQQSKISEQRQRSSSVEARVDMLEREVREMRQLITTLLQRLEREVGRDLDGDGRIG